MIGAPYISLNGEIHSGDQILLSPDNRGIMYGDGCFETMRLYKGKFLGWEEHVERAAAGLNYLGMDFSVDSEVLKDECRKLRDRNGLAEEDAMLRIQWWREGGRGYFESSSRASRIIQCSRLPRPRPNVSLCVAKTRCIPAEALERKYKLSNGLNYIKAAQEANMASCDDALMLTIQEQISETTSANIFWIKEEVVYTPSDQCDLLAGITRTNLLNLMDKAGMKFREGQFTLKDIHEAEAVFLTNSIREIEVVRSLDDQSFREDHPILAEIKRLFEQYKQQTLTL